MFLKDAVGRHGVGHLFGRSGWHNTYWQVRHRCQPGLDRGRGRDEGLLQRRIVILRSQDPRRSSAVVTGIRIRSGTEEAVDHSDLFGQSIRLGFAARFPESSDGLMKRSEPQAITGGCPGTRSQQRVDARRVAVETGLVQRGVPVPVRRVELCALLQEQADEREVAQARGCDQRSRSLGVSRFDIRSPIQQDFDPRRRAFGQRCMEGEWGRCVAEWCRALVLRSCLPERQTSEGEEQGRAGNAGAVEQAKHGSFAR